MPWVKLISLDPKSFAEAFASNSTFLAECPGQLYQVARNLCFQLGADEDNQMDDIVPFIVKSLTWTLQAMHTYPELCFERGPNKSNVYGGDNDDDYVDDPALGEKTDPVLWLMTRLSNIA